MQFNVDEIVNEVQSKTKYCHIFPGLIENIAINEIKKGRSRKETVKAIRNKIHQVANVYRTSNLNFADLTGEMLALPADLQHPASLAFLSRTMEKHASTRERLAIIDDFYQKSLENIPEIHSILDLACGLNPLALAWMPVHPQVELHVCDIYTDQVDFLNAYFDHFKINGRAFCCDLSSTIPDIKTDITYVLKTIPCLEHLRKDIGKSLIEGIQSKYILVSFPAQSLTGRKKGMRHFYDGQFQTLTAEFGYSIDVFSFSNEQGYLVIK